MMLHRRFAIWLGLYAFAALLLMTPLSGVERTRPERLATTSRSIVVTTTSELLAALAAGGEDLAIYLRRGTYQVAQAIEVPDGTALIGEGEMLYDHSGLPAGFVPESRSVIAALPGVTGDFVTLGDRAALRGLVIQDVVRPGLTGGGVVAVSSRQPGDSVSARVGECDIVNPNGLGRTPAGPSGRGLVVITRNPHLTTGDVPHTQSTVSVHLTQSIIRSPAAGVGVFGINFAAQSHVQLQLERNVIGGGLDLVGGSSRPDSVMASTTHLQSIANLYRPDSAGHSTPGWTLTGGSDAPFPNLLAQETLNNRAVVHSLGDRIEGFGQAILAVGGQRFSALAGTTSSNQLELVLNGGRIISTSADVLFHGARSNVAGLSVGESNELLVTMRRVSGSGLRTNEYSNAKPDLGSGNQLLIIGSLNAFNRTNEGILPVPDAQLFTAGR